MDMHVFILRDTLHVPNTDCRGYMPLGLGPDSLGTGRETVSNKQLIELTNTTLSHHLVFTTLSHHLVFTH